MNTAKFSKLFLQEKSLIGMIHVQALPGTPKNHLSISEIADQAVKEAKILAKYGMQSIMLENMHDVPYLNRQVGPEIISALTRICSDVRGVTDLTLGLQVLAGANQAALAVAQAAELQFIRAEGFVFGHMADEGLLQSDAGELLRFRKQIGADDIQIFTDIKKKHSSHALTADVSLEDTSEAAAFFLSDGVIITGTHTGKPVNHEELRSVYASAQLPVLVGSGVTPEGLMQIWDSADAFIVGSYFKQDGNWKNNPDPQRIEKLAQARQNLLG
ncbi:MAG: BtpA/SgcQ family protein [Candidatus Marinimicrobia bacterium]|nr:BtpA/SgcQ family protein [Candidatus Neomarinimicrobiota bacterium]MCF7921666.1 BtpA/SgcQ family protein [Candidatus Neomarinimicrobiota bacterium]